MRPEPAKITSALEKAAPPNATVTALSGLNSRVPTLLTVPLLLKLPLNVCVKGPFTVNDAPPETTKAPPTVQSVSGDIPPALLILTFWKVTGTELSKVGAVLPLKFTVPVVVNPA